MIYEQLDRRQLEHRDQLETFAQVIATTLQDKETEEDKKIFMQSL